MSVSAGALIAGAFLSALFGALVSMAMVGLRVSVRLAQLGSKLEPIPAMLAEVGVLSDRSERHSERFRAMEQRLARVERAAEAHIGNPSIHLGGVERRQET